MARYQAEAYTATAETCELKEMLGLRTRQAQAEASRARALEHSLLESRSAQASQA